MVKTDFNSKRGKFFFTICRLKIELNFNLHKCKADFQNVNFGIVKFR